MARLLLRLLGSFQASLDGRPITTFEADKVRALLAFLAVEGDRPHRRDALAGLLWPNLPDRAARANLRNALANLRGAIGDRTAVPPFLRITPRSIQINPEGDHWIDVTVFADLVDKDELSHLEIAVSLYRGDLLSGFQLKDSIPFEDWYLLSRERMQRQAATALQRLADGYQQRGDYERAAEYARRQVELLPWHEEGHQQLMRLLAGSGHISAALAQYETCRHQLARELGVEPSPETIHLHEQIRDGKPIEPRRPLYPELPPEPGEAPYKGLRHFEQADADLFYGRESLTERLVAQLDPAAGRRFLAVVGASGSGKSSIVRAGLIPALNRGEPLMDGASKWPVTIVIPSDHPLRALATGLTRNFDSGADLEALLDEMARDPQGLHHLICRVLPPGAGRCLLVVDQFEELFTLCRDTNLQRAFVDNLITATAIPGPTTVVITLRADFYAHCGAFQNLREALETNQVYIGPMTDEELRRAVTEPAKQGGWSLEPGLADYMLQEVAKEPGALPLLSHALLETWQRRRGRVLTLAGYTESGGVRGAIARTADQVLQALDPQQQEIARNIFMRLTELGDATRETRRRAKLSELAQSKEQAPAVEQVLETLVGARLVITDEGSAEVAHEVLIREWPMLRGWLESDQQGLRTHRHLTESAQEWERLEKDPGELYRGARLAAAGEWAMANPGALNALEREYLAASQVRVQRREMEREASRQRELAAAQRTAEVQSSMARRLRGRALLLAGVSIIAVALAVFALIARDRAQRETAVSRSLVLAGLAIEVNEAGEVDQALALGLEAVAIDDPPPDAVSKLARVAGGMGTRAVLTGHHGAVRSGAFSPDGSQAVSGGCEAPPANGDCPSGEMILWDLNTMTLASRWPAHEGWISALAWRPGSQEVLSGGTDGRLILWEVTDQEILAQWDEHSAAITALAIGTDGNLAAAADQDGVVTVLDLGRHQIRGRWQGHDGAVSDLAFSPDGRQLLSGSADATLALWDLATGHSVQTFRGHASTVHGVAFLPDGRTILSAGDMSFRLWEAATGADLGIRDSGDFPEGLALSSDGRTVLHYVSHVIYSWDVQEWNDPHRKLFGHTADIQDMSVSADGDLALSASNDGTLRIWNLRGANDLQITDLGFAATAVAVAPDGQTLAVGSQESGGRIWDLDRHQSTLYLTGTVGLVSPGAISFSPDGRWVSASSGHYDQDTEASGLAVWNASTGELICDLQGHQRRSRTVGFGPDGRHVLSGSQGMDESGDLILWDVTDCSLVRRFATDQDTTGIDFSDDGRYAFTSSAFSANSTLWDVETGEAVRVFELPGEVMLDAAFGPDDQTVLAATLSGAIIEWDRGTGEEVRRYSGHDGGVWSVALSPDERRMVSSDDTGVLILWDLSTGAELRRTSAHSALSFQAAFSPDGQVVYSVSLDGTLATWRVGDSSLPALLSWIDANRYVRDLTCEERQQIQVEPLCES